MKSIEKKFKVISGGQTGVDRAALDVALELNIPCGGWCPKGRKAEDGTIDQKYPLQETNSSDYAVRTEMNIKDRDGILILTWGQPRCGTLLTLKRRENINVLNIAGPRQSHGSFVYNKAYDFIKRVLRSL
jgi:hypothetical protein